jgi:hypothetical protein
MHLDKLSESIVRFKVETILVVVRKSAFKSAKNDACLWTSVLGFKHF